MILASKFIVSSINEENMTINENFFSSNEIGKIFSWDEVSRLHKSRNGIYQKKGKLISLLTDFGKINPAYPDFHGETENTIFYTGAGKRGDQKLDIFNQSLLDAIETAQRVPLFCKIAVNQWKFLGFWRVTAGEYIFDETQARMIWKFRLERSKKNA